MEKSSPVTSLVLPAYNPGLLAERTWDAIREFLAHRPDPWEVIFVCDGCTDGSTEKLVQLVEEAGDSRLRVLHYKPNRGKGFAVRAGSAGSAARAAGSPRLRVLHYKPNRGKGFAVRAGVLA